MRDLVAALVALVLLAVALLLAAALHVYRTRRRQAREAAAAEGRRILVELPSGADLTFFSENGESFYYGDRAIRKDDIQAVRVLINGSPIAAVVSPRFPEAERRPPTSFEDRPDGIARDRWDVVIETTGETVLVECGAIRERISQELARTIFNAIKNEISNH